MSEPLVLLNTSGLSSPYPHGAILRGHLSRYENRIRIIDLGLIHARRIVDLCGLYEMAGFLISTDTATLHLGYWNKIPTIALVRDPSGMGPEAWFGSSEPRKHWVDWLSYSESVTTEGLDRIDRAIGALWNDREALSPSEWSRGRSS